MLVELADFRSYALFLFEIFVNDENGLGVEVDTWT